jgi:hypothetical protein
VTALLQSLKSVVNTLREISPLYKKAGGTI